MSEPSYVERLAQQAATFMVETELMAKRRRWQVVSIPLAVEAAVTNEHASSLDDPDVMLLYHQGPVSLGFNPDKMRAGYWLSYFFCDAIDAHGPGGTRLWSQIASMVQYHLRIDHQYRNVRKLDDQRSWRRQQILDRHDNQFAPPGVPDPQIRPYL